MGERVLVTGGSHAELPLIRSLHEMGYVVITTGLNKDGLGHREADLYIPADFSNREAVLGIARDQQVTGIVSGCNDFAYLSAAWASDALSLPGHDAFDVACAVHHKDHFRKVLAAAGLPHPRFAVCESERDLQDARDSLSLPVVVKPTDLTGGKGVTICENWDEARAAYADACTVSRRAGVVMEEFVRGSNHGVSALVVSGKAAFAFFDNEEYYLNPYLVSGAYAPSDLDDDIKVEVISQIDTVVRFLGLCDGLFHCQCIVQRDGTPYLIDPCRRAPGDLYVDLVSHVTGIDYPKAIVKSELGLGLTAGEYKPSAQRNIARECIMADQNGVVGEIRISPNYESHIISRLVWGDAGDRIDDYLKYKAGIVFFEYDTPAELVEAMRLLRDHMQIVVER